MLDDNDSGFDGFSVAEGLAATGNLNFELSDSLSRCSYNLFAQVSDNNSTVQVYADGVVTNQKAILGAPTIIVANYEPNTGITTVYFENSNDPNTVGYILDVTNSQGNDSTYAIVNSGGSSFGVYIDEYETKTLTMTSFDKNGLKGCPSEDNNIVTNIHENDLRENIQNSLIFYPNPTSGRGTIKYVLTSESYCEIKVVDLNGRLIDHPVHENKPIGIYQHEWDFGNLPNGLYFIILRTNEDIVTTKCILNR